MEDAEIEESDTSVLMYTSGTTSLPKGVMLSFGDFTAYVVGTVEMADGEPRGAALLCVPLYHRQCDQHHDVGVDRPEARAAVAVRRRRVARKRSSASASRTPSSCRRC